LVNNLSQMFINIVNLDANPQVINSFDKGGLTKHAYLYTSEELEKVDKTIPTLYVGHGLAKSLYPDIDPIQHRLSDTEFWCFSVKESPTYFMYMFKKFLADVPQALIRNLNYTVLDPLFMDIEKVLKEDKFDVAYARNNHIFFSKGKNTYGINLDFYEGIGKKKYIIDQISVKCNRLIGDKNQKVYNFFVDTFKFDPTTVERHIPYLVNLKR
jgi:hypothetical protein